MINFTVSITTIVPNLIMSAQVDSKSSRRLKRVVNGLEFPSRLTYLNWEPGGEYAQSLVMKNVKLTTQRIKFK